MTTIEKAKETYDITDMDIKESCPHEYGFVDCPEKDIGNPYCRNCSMDCLECWNREYEEGSENGKSIEDL